MQEQPRLTDAEWDLLVDLLQCEHDELPIEIRHTRSSNVRNELQQRADMVRELLEKLTPMAVA